MTLYYYRDPVGNFGDDLNLWLWPRLVPGLFDEDDGHLFLGIGTLLNHRVPRSPLKVVCGAGVGYGQPPRLDERWTFYCVRGPLSARVLGLDPRYAVTDPAALVRTVGLPAEPKAYALSFMPHHTSARRANWPRYCRMFGIHYIDPRADVHSVLRDIQRSECVVTEAMHGAIVADALRVPWVPVRFYDRVDTFKWQDWCASLGLTYEPVTLKRLIGAGPGLWPKLRRRFKPVVSAAGLRRLIRSAEPMLSADAALDLVTSRLQEEVERLRRDHPGLDHPGLNPGLATPRPSGPTARANEVAVGGAAAGGTVR